MPVSTPIAPASTAAPTADTLTGILDDRWAHVQQDKADLARWGAFVEAFGQTEVDGPESAEHVLPVLLACLLQDSIDHRRLIRPALSVLRAHPSFAPIMAASTDDDRGSVFELDGELRATLTHPLILLLLQRVVVPDHGWERLFTGVRRHLTGSWRDLLEPDDVASATALALSLARQCHANGYVWRYHTDEVRAVEQVASEMTHAELGSGPGDRLKLGIIAAYVPLIHWERASEVVAWAERSGDAALLGLARQQIVEPEHEAVLREVIPAVGDLANEVSAEVRAMYEEHPYPRWSTLRRRSPTSLVTMLEARFPWVDTTLIRDEDAPRVLVAGCGTGRHMLELAYALPRARIVGVDLSTASLAFAARKAAELGLQNVSLVQADILSLANSPDDFHFIECGGVLHHMEHPLVGWRALTERLSPGGFMKVGLYSERARRSVRAAREVIAAKGWGSSDDEIRRVRPLIEEIFRARTCGSPTQWADFFSLHECRDLLFHVQEHRFTIPWIDDCLRALDLEFVGWEGLAGDVWRAFRAEQPAPGAERDLAAWDSYEDQHPDTFRAMYHFWVRRPD